MVVCCCAYNCRGLFKKVGHITIHGFHSLIMTTKWGIVSAGKISHDFVSAVRSIPLGDHEIVAVATRNLESAAAFATLHKIPKSYGSYEELAKDSDVEVVYVGSINPQHYPLAKLMLESKKHLLVEKPMTMNAKHTKELVEMARVNKCFLMEAMWSRFLPSYKFLMQILEEKAVGEVVHVDASFGIPLTGVDRLTKKVLGGGSLLDIGIYTLNAVSQVYKGEKPSKIASVGHLNDDGVDVSTCTSLQYGNMKTASVRTSTLAQMSCEIIITGTKGQIKVPSPMWCPTSIETPEKIHEFTLPDTIVPCNFTNSSGLRYEAVEVRECLKKGLLESPVMSLNDSLLLAETMDEIRRQIGVVYPEDED